MFLIFRGLPLFFRFSVFLSCFGRVFFLAPLFVYGPLRPNFAMLRSCLFSACVIIFRCLDLECCGVVLLTYSWIIWLDMIDVLVLVPLSILVVVRPGKVSRYTPPADS